MKNRILILLILAVSALGFGSSAAATTVADPVTNLTASATQTAITWTWQPPASGSNGYGVTVDGTYAGSRLASNPSWTLQAACGTMHTISVKNWFNSTKSIAVSNTAATLKCTTTGAIKRVVLIVFENTNYELTRGHMPYLDGLANKNAYFTNYYALTHPSLPNYMGLTGGIAQPATSCEPSACHSTNPSIFSELGTDWRDWSGGVKPCDKAISTGYDPDHNPAVYYTNLAATCPTNDLPYTQFKLSAASFALVTPKEPQQYPTAANTWLSNWLPANVLNQPDYQDGSTLVLITFDEGNFKNPPGPINHVYTVAVNPNIKPGTVVTGHYTHYDLLRTAQDLLGVPCLANTCSASSFAGALGVS